jgi:uncharacterized phage infection (PIP) family protein YhgE
VQLTRAAEIVFAVAAVVAVASLIAAVGERVSRRTLLALGIVLALTAAACWAGFALHERAAIAVSATGIMLAAVAELAAAKILDLVGRLRRIDERFAEGEARLSTLIAVEASARAGELEHTLVRARADSASLLAEQERKMGEEWRRAAEQRERELGASLADTLTKTQRQLESRLRGWTEDLERAQHAVDDQLAQLAQGQRQLIAEAEARIAADVERLESESEQQREGLVRLREELTGAIQETNTAGNAELENYAADRRRALHELNDRIRQRERSLTEQVERAETEATRRIQAAFADVERRQVEQLERILNRATSSYSDEAAQQFSDAIRASRDDAATRLSRELDRAVQAYAREGERVIAEQLAHVGDAGAQRLEKRLSQAGAGLERQRTEAIAAFEQRLIATEHELRRRVEAFAADVEAERAVLEARLQELARRIDEAIARA